MAARLVTTRRRGSDTAHQLLQEIAGMTIVPGALVLAHLEFDDWRGIPMTPVWVDANTSNAQGQDQGDGDGARVVHGAFEGEFEDDVNGEVRVTTLFSMDDTGNKEPPSTTGSGNSSGDGTAATEADIEAVLDEQLGLAPTCRVADAATSGSLSHTHKRSVPRAVQRRRRHRRFALDSIREEHSRSGRTVADDEEAWCDVEDGSFRADSVSRLRTARSWAAMRAARGDTAPSHGGGRVAELSSPMSDASLTLSTASSDEEEEGEGSGGDVDASPRQVLMFELHRMVPAGACGNV